CCAECAFYQNGDFRAHGGPPKPAQVYHSGRPTPSAFLGGGIPPSLLLPLTLKSCRGSRAHSRRPGQGGIMRIALWALLALTLGPPAAGDPPWADKLFPDGTSHDFGSVPRGTQLFYRFKMTNIYKVPLEIMATRTSCGCVSVTPAMK